MTNQTSYPLMVLGAPDPEMQAIKELAREFGLTTTHAYQNGQVVGPGNAYQATYPTPEDFGANVPQFWFVECAVAGVTPAVVFDHHRPGDPGFGKPPSQYWEGSSIGQFWTLLRTLLPEEQARLTELRHDMQLDIVAAADHCLGAAYQGQCPGVSPDDLFQWRLASRAEYQGKDKEELFQQVRLAIDLVKDLPKKDLGSGVSYRDAGDQRIPELPEAAAILAEAVQYRMLDRRSERVKVGLLGANPDVVKAWMDHQRNRLTDLYGDPARGFAGGYL